MTRMWTDLYAIRKIITDYQIYTGEYYRLMKLAEEVGEVNEAFLSYECANARKLSLEGSAQPNDVAKELCDVVITAIVALGDWCDDPKAELKAAVKRVAKRCAKEGS